MERPATFIRNGWYCAGLTTQLSQVPLARKILGEHVALYRKANGEAVAIGGRCAHRFAPLAQGRVVGDTLECPYHGLRFGVDGRCVHVPQPGVTAPAGSGVPSYPLVERQGALWIWMGKAELADVSRIVDLDFIDNPEFRVITGTFEVAADYRLVMDNLLDLSHAPFIHAATLSAAPGKPDARSYHRVSKDGNKVSSETLFADFPTSAQMRPLVDYDRGDAWATMEWLAPSNFYMNGTVQPTGTAVGTDLKLPSAHLLTPIDDKHTSYYFFAGRNRRRTDADQDVFQELVIRRAFEQEDAPIMEACQSMMGDADFMSLRPLVLPADAAALKARRLLALLISAEGGFKASSVQTDISREKVVTDHE